MKKLIAIVAFFPAVAFAQSQETLEQLLHNSLLAESKRDKAVADAIDFRSFTEKQNYIETGNIYGDKSDAPVKFNYGGTTITGDPLGGAQRKYEVQKFEGRSRYGR